MDELETWLASNPKGKGGKPCRICSSEFAELVNKHLLAGVDGARMKRWLDTKDFHIAASSIGRHKNSCLKGNK